MIVTLEEVRSYLIDIPEGNETDTFIDLCIGTAEIYLKKSINNYELKKDDEEFQTALKIPALLLVQQMYDNRSLDVATMMTPTLQNFIIPLSYSFE